MDWKGQKQSRRLMYIMPVVFAASAFITGYCTGSHMVMLLIYTTGVIVTAAITVPNWSFFNQHLLNWLDPVEADRHQKPQPKPQPMISKMRRSFSKCHRYSRSWIKC